MKTIITVLFLSVALFTQAQRGGGGHHHHHGPVPMSSAAFSQAMNQMDRESFDDGKLRIAKGIINGNYLLSQQVKVLVGEFSFKRSQEEVALYAYPKTYDQNKYYMVYEAFSYDSSKDRVSEWVSRQPINDYQGNSYYGPRPITDANFAQGLRYVKAESFDDGKLRVAKQLIDGNYIYADQVAALVKEFDFKNNEEAIAKYAYPKTYDQKNYYLIYDAFSYNSSKDDLEDWLRGQPINDYTRPPHHGNNNGGGHHGNNNGGGHHGNNNGGGHHGNNNGGGYHGNNNGGGHNGNNNGGGHNGNNNGGGHHGNNNGGGHNGNNNGGGHHGNNNGGGHNGNNNGGGHNGNNNGGGHHGNNNGRPYNGNNNNNNNNNLNDDRLNGSPTLGQNSNNNNNQGNSLGAMSARDFDTMKARITDFSSDNDRINKAKEYLSTNFLLAEQVKEVMGLFVFDDVRLDFAKAAYAKTYDPQNYNLVESVLLNPSSKQDLKTYIDNY